MGLISGAPLMVGAAWLWMPSPSPWARRPGRLVLGWLLVAPPVLTLAGGDRAWGGAYGELTGGSLSAAFGRIGAWILLLALLAAGSLLLGKGRPPGWLRTLGRALWALVILVRGLVRKLTTIRLPDWRPRLSPTPSPVEGPASAGAAPPESPTPEIPRVVAGEEPAPPRAPAPRIESGPAAAPPAVAPSDPDPDPGLLDLEPLSPAAEEAPVRRVRRAPEHRKRPLSEFELPPETLFSDPPPSIPGKSRDELVAESELLRRTLEEFGIRGRVGEVHPGPVITRYDFEPAPGIKVNQIVNREDDIALALRSDRVRILSRVPGKAAVGIEIPNESPEIIHFRDVIKSRAYRESRGVLTLALGKTTAGLPFCDALESMPHLLVAGATGSGKSVCLNTMIVSLLLRHSPEDLRLIMIDPKMLELTGYNGIPHLALPVVTESKEAAKSLNWLVREMERRYRVLAERGVRNIGIYRDRFFPDGVAAPVGKDETPPVHRFFVRDVPHLFREQA